MKKTQLSTILIFTLLIFSSCDDQNITVAEESNCDYSQLTSEEMKELQDYGKDITMKIQPESGDTVATLRTTYGDIKVLLYTNEAPNTTKNFIDLAEAGKYDKTIYHRVMDCFMIQAGDFENSNGTGGYSAKGPGTNIKDEFGPGLKHLRGAVSMANIGMPDTGGSQFFIVQADHGTPWLDGAHAVFGYVYEGMDIVDKIAQTKTDLNDRPLEDIIIESVETGTY